MTHWSRAFLAIAGVLAFAGCAGPTTPPSPLGRAWRPALSLPATESPVTSALIDPPTRVQAPGRTSAVTAGATAAPIDAPPIPVIEAGMQYSPMDRICFQSNRRPSAGGYDIYVYDPAEDTVLAVVGVNTPADETNPSCSDDGRWLAFQRGVKVGDTIQQDVLLYNQQTRMVNTLRNANTIGANETEPDLGVDGHMLVYVSDEGGYTSIRLFDVASGSAFEVPGAGRRALRVARPTLSGDANRIAYEAAPIAPPASSDIFLYDIPTATQLTPPFVNTPAKEAQPELSADGSRLLFTSDRFGNDDIFEANLDTGLTDNLSFLNTEDDEQEPRYLGGSCDRLAYQLRTRGDYPQLLLRAFNRLSMQIDTLPVANVLIGDSALAAAP